MLLNLLVSIASAGKLADGLFGVPWAEPPAVAPMPACTLREGGWLCDAKVADVPANVLFVVEHGALFAVTVLAFGADGCQTVRDAYEAAWGDSTPTNAYLTKWTDDQFWRDGVVWAIWQYDRYTASCAITAVHRDNQQRVTAAKKADAARAAEGL